MKDDFFSQEKCDRCGGKLKVRIMSWFNDQTICMNCHDKEGEIRTQLPERGRSYEGCGYIPNPDEVAK